MEGDHDSRGWGEERMGKVVLKLEWKDVCRKLGALSIWPKNFETLKTWGLQENLIIDESARM